MKSRLKQILGTTALLTIIGITGCETTPEKQWVQRLNECNASSQLAPLNNCIYFGTSDGVGPGTVLLKNPKGGYQILFRITDAETNGDTLTKLFTKDQNPHTCSDGSSYNWTLSPTALVSSAADTNINAGLAIALSHAKQISYSMKGWSLDTLNYVPYLKASRHWDEIYQNILSNTNAIVIGASYRIEGFTVTCSYDSTNSAMVAASLPAGSTIAISKILGINAKISWTRGATNYLQIVANGDFYVFGNPWYMDYRASTDINNTPSFRPVKVQQGAGVTANLVVPGVTVNQFHDNSGITIGGNNSGNAANVDNSSNTTMSQKVNNQ